MSKGIATIADIQEIESVPLERRVLPVSTYAAIQQGAALNPDKIALQFFLQGLEFDDVVFYTYKDLLALINQTANMFAGLGIGKEDTVSTILPNLPQSYFALWGGQTAGIANPINPLLDAAELAEIMNLAGTKLLVTLAPFIGTDIWQKVASIIDQVPTLKTILQVDLSNYLSTTRKLAIKWLRLRGDGGPKVHVPVYDFGKVARRFTGENLLFERVIDRDDTAAYFHTGGTNEKPILVKLSHFNEVANAWAAAEALSFSSDQLFFCGQPHYHVEGSILSSLLPWMNGASIVLGSLSGFNDEGVLANFWAIVDYHQVTSFSAPASFYDSLLSSPVGDADISSLELALCIEGPLSGENFHQFANLTGLTILEGFVQSASAGIVSVNPVYGEKRVGSIGLRLPYLEMKAAHLDSSGHYLKDCAVNETGTVIFRGPFLCSGILEKNVDKAAWIDTRDGKGVWYCPGVNGRQDKQGYFWLNTP